MPREFNAEDDTRRRLPVAASAADFRSSASIRMLSWSPRGRQIRCVDDFHRQKASDTARIYHFQCLTSLHYFLLVTRASRAFTSSFLLRFVEIILACHEVAFADYRFNSGDVALIFSHCWGANIHMRDGLFETYRSFGAKAFYITPSPFLAALETPMLAVMASRDRGKA